MNFARLKEKISQPQFYLSVLLFLLALILRIYLISRKSLWGDEFYAAGLMNQSFSDLITGSFVSSPHPPLAFFFPRIAVAAFGISETSLRIVPALMSSLAAVPLFLFVKNRLSRISGFAAGLLWVLSPYSVSLGQEGWLYGTLACFGFTFVYTADLAWRGRKAASILLIPLGLAGMMVQHLFFLFLAAGFLLYFTYPRDSRASFKKFLLLCGLMALVYAPFVAPALSQASERSARIASATTPSFMVIRMFSRIPTIFARLIPGGLAAEFSLTGISVSVTSALLLISLGLVAVSLILFLTDRKTAGSLRIWTAGVLLVPLLLFLREDPTVRHLSILWIPLGLSAASLFRRYKPAGAALIAFAGILLFPYYRITTFPYHRADWREAVRIVQSSRNDQQKVVILAGQNAGLAWDFYAGADTDRIAPNGERPYAPVSVRCEQRAPVAVVDSLLSIGNQVWVVNDIWGGPAGADIAPRYHVLVHESPSPHIEVLLFGSRPSSI